jgi:hypothetical protein
VTSFAEQGIITEQDALLVAAQKMGDNDPALSPLDVAGLRVIDADNHGSRRVD